jgi:hypothetical protein
LIVLNVDGFGLWHINLDAKCSTLRDTEERLDGRSASCADKVSAFDVSGGNHAIKGRAFVPTVLHLRGLPYRSLAPP